MSDDFVDRFNKKTENIVFDMLCCRPFKSKDLQVYEPEMVKNERLKRDFDSQSSIVTAPTKPTEERFKFETNQIDE